MKKSDLIQIADFVEERLEKKFQRIEQRFEQVDKRFDQMDKEFGQVYARFEKTDQNIENMEERIMTSVKTEIDRLDSRLDEVVIELKKKPDRYEVFDWTEKRIAQLKFN